MRKLRSPAAFRCRVRLAAAIAEVGAAEACLTLLENPDAEIAPFSLDRIVERFGHLAPIRENLLARDDLPAATRQALVAKLSQTLAGFVASRANGWGRSAPQYHAQEACEKATVALAARHAERRGRRRWSGICARPASSPPD